MAEPGGTDWGDGGGSFWGSLFSWAGSSLGAGFSYIGEAASSNPEITGGLIQGTAEYVIARDNRKHAENLQTQSQDHSEKLQDKTRENSDKRFYASSDPNEEFTPITSTSSLGGIDILSDETPPMSGGAPMNGAPPRRGLIHERLDSRNFRRG